MVTDSQGFDPTKPLITLQGSTCHRNRFNYTCSGVRKSGERRSDVYYIDFDGMGPMQPVKALCDLGRTVETTTTQINNTKYLDFDVTRPSGMLFFFLCTVLKVKKYGYRPGRRCVA